MKTSLILFYFCLSVFSLTAEEVDVILIGGQSNATGQGYMKNMPVQFVTNKNVQIYYSKELHGGGESEKWQPLCQASESPDRFGVELSLGTELQKSFPKKKWAIIKHAVSGANLFNNWNPTSGPVYQTFLKTVQSGLNVLKKKGHTPVLRAMVWQQGEGDAHKSAGIKQSQAYAKNLSQFIKAIRSDLSTPDLLFVYGTVMPYAEETTPGRLEVKKAQQDVAESSNTPYSTKGAILVEADDVQTRNTEYKTPYPTDCCHLGTYGILTLGERFAKVIGTSLKK